MARQVVVALVLMVCLVRAVAARPVQDVGTATAVMPTTPAASVTEGWARSLLGRALTAAQPHSVNKDPIKPKGAKIGADSATKAFQRVDKVQAAKSSGTTRE